MTSIKTYQGELTARGLKFAIVAARFNDFVVDRMLSGAVETLKSHGADDADIEIARVPGAFDLPLIAQKMAESKRYQAIVALGAVIRGDTAHFDFVAGECASGLTRASLDAGIPIAFGVITTENVEQAMDRAGGKAGNKGADAALVAIELANLLSRLDR
jgi:6,7-dimethyl-8-ribityllumazine synthase